MIVRERNNDYIMIEQDNHARISGELAAAWKDTLFAGKQHRNSVEYAVSNHDLGWKLIDIQPFWNDAKNMPYTFTDFPIPAKTVFYKHGIEEVAARDSYAALLCSRHYASFLQNQKLPGAEKFVHDEGVRQKHIISTMETFNQADHDFHYGLLKFCDNVSLYLCLNEPGIAKQQEHPFFKNGIPIPFTFDFFQKEKAHIHWQDKQTAAMEVFPFTKPIDFTLKQKAVAKQAILDKGLLGSYQTTPSEELKIRLTPTSLGLI